MERVINEGPCRLERSGATGKAVPVEKLVWAKRRFNKPAGHNYLPYSNYNASGWTMGTGTDAGTISIGSDVDGARVKYDSGNTASYTGVQTWMGSDTATSAAVTTSSWTRVCFSAIVGIYHRESSATFTVTMQVLDQSSAVLATSTMPLSGTRRYYCAANITPATTSVTCVITVTASVATGKWFFEKAQLENNTLLPGVHIATNGAAVSRDTDQVGYTVCMVEDDEVERVVEDWEKRGIPRGDPSYPTVTRTKF